MIIRAMQVEVVKLNDELAEILNEADYMKEKEVRFHTPKLKELNVAAVWWPVLQIGILVATAVLQVQAEAHAFESECGSRPPFLLMPSVLQDASPRRRRRCF